MKAPCKLSEAKSRTYNKKLKREALEAQKHRLPNEFKRCLDDYNHSNIDGVGYIDSNDYGYS